ncbi:hypothetical protein [uncultured Shewanella sp.]|uniref:GHMP family kinase ATP-binding protein n=1 Tax=uncultured Shewanella sp. TaxID=173975 RepID=UPI00261FF443|nr:hypothetical protein [uncultured Shewanella sp.]
MDLMKAQIPLRIGFVGGGTDFPEVWEQVGTGATVSTCINKYIQVEHHPHKQRAHNPLTSKYFADPEHFSIQSMGGIAIGSGLGTSSSIYVAIAELNNNIHLKKMNKFDIANYARDLELRSGNIVGWQDHITASYRNSIHVNYNLNHITVNIIPSSALSTLFQFISVYYYGKRHHTGTKLQSHLINSINESTAYFSELTILANTFASELKNMKPKIKLLGEMIWESWKLKRLTNPLIAPENLNELLNYAKSNGCWGAKLMGAGSGGYILAVGEKNHCDDIFCKKFNLQRMDIGLHIEK